MAWSDTMNWRDGRWWVTFQNEAVEVTLPFDDFMRFGVVGYAPKNSECVRSPRLKRVDLSRAKKPRPYRESSERGRAARKRGSGYPHALERFPAGLNRAVVPNALEM